MVRLSLAVATYNEERNIKDCIRSCKDFADEIIVVDGSSPDRTREIAQKEGAVVIKTDNPQMFHINKQKAIDATTGEWILQLDADERVTPELAEEIQKIIQMTNEEIQKYQESLEEKKLFKRHEELIFSKSSHTVQSSAGAHLNSETNPQLIVARGLRLHHIASDFTYNAFFISRLNYFLGGYLRYGGVYPDGVIRLIRKGKAYLPCKDVHELMQVEGRIGWLAHPLIHRDSPTFKRYLERNNRYIDYETANIKQLTANKSRVEIVRVAIQYLFFKPVITFLSLFFRHKGLLDGWRGLVFAFFSSVRFIRAYLRYLLQVSVT